MKARVLGPVSYSTGASRNAINVGGDMQMCAIAPFPIKDTSIGTANNIEWEGGCLYSNLGGGGLGGEGLGRAKYHNTLVKVNMWACKPYTAQKEAFPCQYYRGGHRAGCSFATPGCRRAWRGRIRWR